MASLLHTKLQLDVTVFYLSVEQSAMNTCKLNSVDSCYTMLSAIKHIGLL